MTILNDDRIQNGATLARRRIRARFVGYFWTLSVIMFATVSYPAQDIKVTLLGTGAPVPVMTRFGPSILVEAGGRKLLFDAGRGALQRLEQLKLSQREISAVFLTHLHSDHVVGFPDLWLTGWLVGLRRSPLPVYGPAGTRSMTSHLSRAFEFDIKFRVSDDGADPRGAIIAAKDIVEGVVYEDGGVKVTAFTVDHSPVKPALGYRVDFGGHSVVLSGDTRFSENLIKFAKGTDVLIHEVASREAFQRMGQDEKRAASVVHHHTTAREAGVVFARVAPRLAVYSHIVPPSSTEADLITPARENYAGPLELGSDLMTILIGEKIEVKRFPK